MNHFIDSFEKYIVILAGSTVSLLVGILTVLVTKNSHKYNMLMIGLLMLTTHFFSHRTLFI